MIFLVVVPILAGFANYLVPLMIGARDMAFPRLNALSLLAVCCSGGSSLYFSFFAKGGAAARDGRVTRPSRRCTHRDTASTCGSCRCTSSRSRSIAGAVNFVVTIHNMRAPGMSWTRIPLFVWAMLTYGWMLLIVLPSCPRR